MLSILAGKGVHEFFLPARQIFDCASEHFIANIALVRGRNQNRPAMRQADDLLVNRPVDGSRALEEKLAAALVAHPWMVFEDVSETVSKIANENASVKSKRPKVIAIANRMTAALAPYVACKSGCSECCRMNTVIYEHEAIRLAEVSGRKMSSLPFRPPSVVHAEGMKFNGKPRPFLVDSKCSVYEDRPLLCRTHHSLRESADECSMDIPAAEQVRPPMYDPDVLEAPYRAMNAAYRPMEPCGNIGEFFPD
ncbi:YkgJ family cysteine cluster protein [Massilia norwichensis]|uniref:YkgJ family cysteine cluster protein n=1 Tax=Massilia norwichensis TaxID=1442366 RepID=A0ABT2AE80_9BURK|nr:YkgJ family cysteine cluster protein [Massilia norwichensis]